MTIIVITSPQFRGVICIFQPAPFSGRNNIKIVRFNRRDFSLLLDYTLWVKITNLYLYPLNK